MSHLYLHMTWQIFLSTILHHRKKETKYINASAADLLQPILE